MLCVESAANTSCDRPHNLTRTPHLNIHAHPHTRTGRQAYVTYVNTIEGLLPYMIVLDRQRKTVVLAVRGSMSVADVVTGG